MQFADGITVFYSQYTQQNMDVLLRSQSTTALPDRLTQINLYPNTFLPLKCARHLPSGYTKEECLGLDFVFLSQDRSIIESRLVLRLSMTSRTIDIDIEILVKCQQKTMIKKCNCHPSYFNEGM